MCVPVTLKLPVPAPTAVTVPLEAVPSPQLIIAVKLAGFAFKSESVTPATITFESDWPATAVTGRCRC